MPPKKPATSAMIVAKKQQSAAEASADEQGVAAAVEHPRGDVAALVVGAQEVVVDVPGRPDRRHAEAEAAGASTITGCCLPSISVVPSIVDSNGCVCAT